MNHPRAIAGTATDSQKRQRRNGCGRAKYCRSMRLASFLVVRVRRSIVQFSKLQGHYCMHSSQQQQRIRKGNVHEEPSVENLVQAALFVELPFLLANVFQ